MEIRILVSARSAITAFSVALLLLAPVAQAKQRQDLRLYRVNKDGISDRFWFTRGKARKPGCHNIVKKSRLHRAVQFGYPVCHIYTKKNCAADSILSFTRDGETESSTSLLQGYSWFSVSEHKRGERIKSWYCGELIEQSDSEIEQNDSKAEG